MPSALVLLLFCATPIVLANFWLRNSAGSLPPGIVVRESSQPARSATASGETMTAR